MISGPVWPTSLLGLADWAYGATKIGLRDAPGLRVSTFTFIG